MASAASTEHRRRPYRSGGCRRWGAASALVLVPRVVLALALATTAVIVTPHRAAAAHQILQWNESGDSYTVFGPNAFVTIYNGTIEYSCDSFYPTADIYVVEAGFNRSAPLADVSGAPNTVTGASGGYFSDTIAVTQPTSKLGPGRYAVVYDECQDGDFDPDMDAVFDPAFRVVLPADLPPMSGVLPQFKTDAATERDHWAGVLGAYEALEKIQEYKEYMDCALAIIASGGAGCAVSMVTDAAKDKLVEALRAAAGFIDPKDAAKDRVRDIISHYHGIALDPPDPNFSQSTLLEPVSDLAATGAVLDRTLVGVGEAAATEGALAEALLRSIERYQGADAAGDAQWGLHHARAIASYADHLADQLTSSGAALSDLRSALAGDGVDLDVITADLAAKRDHIAAVGFSGDQRKALAELGYDDAALHELRVWIAQQAFVAGAESAMVTAVDGLLASHGTATTNLRQLAVDMRAVAATLAAGPNVDPSLPVADAGGPYAAPVGDPLVLDATGSTGAPSSYGWDQDRDGQFDDATGAAPSVTFAAPFDGLVGLQVTGAGGATDVAYARVVVGATNAPPTIDAFSPTASLVLAGSTITYAVTATDPDSDAVSVRWLLDGSQVATGTSFTYSPTAAAAGLRVLEVVADDGHPHHTTRETRSIRVLHPDADDDGWRSDLDCDDNDPLRSPGRVERAGNGIDDDCDPTTDDTFSPPNAVDFHSAATYLHTNSDNPRPPAVVDLGAGGFEPGDVLAVAYLIVEPFSFYGCSGPFTTEVGGGGVFSSTTEILSPTERHRVPGAIHAGVNHWTPNTYWGDEPTDIPEDFRFSPRGDFVVQVPPGAEYAMFGVIDKYYQDNCGSLRVILDEVFPAMRSNTAPTATADTGATQEGVALDLPVAGLLANDTDPDGDPLQIVEVTGRVETRGTVTLVGEVVRYVPEPGWYGPVSFSYTVDDGYGGRSTATVAIDVAFVNDSPVANDDAVGLLLGDTSVTLAASTLLVNDTDGDGHPLMVTDVGPTSTTVGTVVFDGTSFTYTAAPGFVGTDALRYGIADGHGGIDEAVATVFVEGRNQPPSADAGRDVSGTEGSPVTLAGGVSDPDGDALTIAWSATAASDVDAGAICTFANRSEPTTSLTCTDDGIYTVTLTINDGTNPDVTDSATVTVANAAPSITSIDAPVDPVAVNTAMNVSVPFTDPGINDTHVCRIDWGDASTATVVDPGTSPCAASHSYTAAGVYTLAVTVTDDDGRSHNGIYQYVVVYDPDAGFVTGGGWIDSPSGAYTADVTMTGKANFGFVSKYKKGTTVPDGQTEFQFHAAGLDFHSTVYEWLVVSGPKAQYKGSGTINGAGDYGFMLTANDGQVYGGGGVDKFRIKIWDKATGEVVYDNQVGDADDSAASDAIESGSIVIHKG